LIRIYKARGEEQKVIDIYLDLLDKDPEDIGAKLELGYYYLKHGDPEAGRALLQSLGEESLDDEKIVQKLIQDYLTPKRYDAALAILGCMLEGAPESSELNYLAGVAYSGREEDKKALSHFEKVQKGSRFYQNAVVHIAFIYQEQGSTAEAIRFLSEVRKELPDNPEILIYLGSFYEEIESFEKAVETLKQGIEIDPKNSRIYFRLGVVYDKWNRKEDSIQTMKKVIELDPQNANALNYLGYTYADLGRDLDEAERLIKEALKYKPEDGYITDSLGWVYYKKGEFQKAVEILEKAVRLVPDDPIILEHLGDAYLKINSTARALEFYERSLLHKKKDREAIEKKIQTLTGKGADS